MRNRFFRLNNGPNAFLLVLTLTFSLCGIPSALNQTQPSGASNVCVVICSGRPTLEPRRGETGLEAHADVPDSGAERETIFFGDFKPENLESPKEGEAQEVLEPY
jgi:hypothetical protein